jgi:hypothetical protein
MPETGQTATGVGDRRLCVLRLDRANNVADPSPRVRPPDPIPLLQSHYEPSSLLRIGPSRCFASVLSPHGFRRLCFSLRIKARFLQFRAKACIRVADLNQYDATTHLSDGAPSSCLAQVQLLRGFRVVGAHVHQEIRVCGVLG